ncbi:copper resistance protein CopC [Terriglobus aquaticus]|uniref:Copper resistance protein CopC n=1 Tax=Terriglobus aquaticus TaxID=940139 RepID=A0ABW9KJS8_9BACT|nr:copper resistance protein CopC [Terriglobus aquaticus]
MLLCSAAAEAQGCSQCRDTVSQTNPAQQQSYRIAIAIMLAGAVSVVGAGVFVIRRFGR